MYYTRTIIKLQVFFATRSFLAIIVKDFWFYLIKICQMIKYAQAVLAVTRHKLSLNYSIVYKL